MRSEYMPRCGHVCKSLEYVSHVRTAKDKMAILWIEYCLDCGKETSKKSIEYKKVKVGEK